MKWIKLLLSFMFTVVLLFEVYTLIAVYTEGNAALPGTFGNFERVRALLADDERRDEFSFAVVGDTRGTGTFERIAEALRHEPLSFMVLLGDCVQSGTSGYHRYFRAEWGEELVMPFPVFYVVGNHDVDGKEFPMSQFEKTYGPSIFSFDYQGHLFIALNIMGDSYWIKKSIAYLASLLLACRHDYRKVFVFMHIPPPVFCDFDDGRELQNSELVALCDRFNIDYLIGGNFHGYSRVKRKNTTYLLAVGGGAGLRKSRKFGRFHHAIVIKVGPNSVSEQILFVNKEQDFEDVVERFALAELYPWIVSHWPAAILLNVGILALLFWDFPGLLKDRRIS